MKQTEATFPNSLYAFVAADLAAHRNPVTCVLHGLDRPLRVNSGDCQIEADVVAIRPGVEHGVRIDGRARVLYFTSLEFPFDSPIATPMRGRFEQVAVDALDGPSDAQADLRDRLSRRERSLPSAIVSVLRDISADPMTRMTQTELAIRLGKERTTALRLFRQATGLTFRHYKQWIGLQEATRRIAAGDLVRTAAMDGGFADAAHLTRTFRATFGTTPQRATADQR